MGKRKRRRAKRNAAWLINKAMLLCDLFEKKNSSGTAWVVVHTTDKLILGKRSAAVNNPNLWNFFGGHIDAGETAAEAAAREMEEEIGLTVSPNQLKLITSIGDATYFSYKASNSSGMRKTAEISKIDSFKLTDLPNNLHAKTQRFFDQLEALLS